MESHRMNSSSKCPSADSAIESGGRSTACAIGPRAVPGSQPHPRLRNVKSGNWRREGGKESGVCLGSFSLAVSRNPESFGRKLNKFTKGHLQTAVMGDERRPPRPLLQFSQTPSRVSLLCREVRPPTRPSCSARRNRGNDHSI